MSNYINKYNSFEAYEADETKQYPNISLIEGVGLEWQKEEPEPSEIYLFEKNGDVYHLLIKHDNAEIVMVNSNDYPDVSAEAIENFIALGKAINGVSVTIYLTNYKGDETEETVVHYDSDNNIMALVDAENSKYVPIQFYVDKGDYVVDFTEISNYNSIEFTLNAR